jgi:transmembrane sensor
MAGFDSRKDIKKMIEKYVAGTATDEEISFVESYYAYQERRQEASFSAGEAEELQSAGFENIKRQIEGSTLRETNVRPLYKYASIAALLLLTLTTGYWFLIKRPSTQKPLLSAKKSLDVLPGSNKAILTLADGSRIILDDKADGKLRELAGLTITKTKGGQLIYKVSGNAGADGLLADNTVSTPKGGQYQVILPDGTHVWLNAASSLTYPEIFKGKQRTVKLEGEGYFEVAKNKSMPFHVLTTGQDVEVTGTHFNINAYRDDQSINTTLLEGAVTVHYADALQKIVPGQQALVFTQPSIIKAKLVDTEEQVAWKNGLFEFNNSNLKNILSQLERWYDIKVDYSSIPAKRYSGMVPRSANLSQVLNMLELTGNVHFKIEAGRHLKVTSNSN